MSYLTQSESELWDAVVEALEGEGFDYNPLTTTRSEYLATALGEPTAYLRQSFARLAAEVNAGFGGSLSYLTSSPAHLLDDLDTNIGGGGGGEEPYVADAVTIALPGVIAPDNEDEALSTSDSPYGVISLFTKRTASNAISIFTNSQLIIGCNVAGCFNFELADYVYENFIYLTAEDGALPDSAWKHVLIAWDMDHPADERLYAVYVADVPVPLTINGSDEGAAFSVGYQNLPTQVLSGGGVTPTNDYAEFGMWVGLNIVEADKTISQVNRRKFVTADGKPVDPTNWPANPIIKFVGNAAAFLTNQGSDADFVNTTTITDEETSPSD